MLFLRGTLETTRSIIGQIGHLEVICDSWSQRPATYPSWCLDWSQCERNVVMAFGKYEADAKTKSNAVFSADGKIISCKGCCLGVASKVGETY